MIICSLSNQRLLDLPNNFVSWTAIAYGVSAVSILEAALEAGDAACKAKQFVERQSMITDFRAKAATDDGS